MDSASIQTNLAKLIFRLMKKMFRKEVVIGLIVILALAVLFVGIDFLKGVNVFKAANYYYVTYDNVEGLAQSAPVTVNGFKVGQVRSINYEYDNPGHIKVEISLDRNLKVPTGTQAVLTTDLLGTASVVLNMAAAPTYHKIGDELVGVKASGLMDNVSNDVLPALGGIFSKVDTLLTSINGIVASPELAMSIQRLNTITANLENTTRQLDKLMSTLPPITANINTVSGNLSTASADFTKVSGKLSQMPLDSISQNVAQLTNNLRELSEQLNDPNSSLGMLTHDPALYQNLNSTVSSLDSLFIDIKRNPKRYINIKLL